MTTGTPAGAHALLGRFSYSGAHQRLFSSEIWLPRRMRSSGLAYLVMALLAGELVLALTRSILALGMFTGTPAGLPICGKARPAAVQATMPSCASFTGMPVRQCYAVQDVEAKRLVGPLLRIGAGPSGQPASMA